MSFREDTIPDIQAMLKGRLESDPYFVDITVVDEAKEDYSSQVDKALAPIAGKGGKFGVCVIVLQPEATDEYPDAGYQGPLTMQFKFDVLENPELNKRASGTKKRALSVCRRISKVMKHFTCGGYTQPCVPATPLIVPIEDPGAPAAFEVRFNTQEAVKFNEPKVSTPTFRVSYAPFLVTLDCVTVEARIYYTLDGSYPWSGNANATLYTVPFTPEGEVLIMAGAYKDYHIASNVADKRFTTFGTEDGAELSPEGSTDPLGLI